MHALFIALLALASDPLPAGQARLWWGDWNGDGRLDAVQAVPGAPARLLENRGQGVFADVSASAGWPPLQGLRRVVFADLDGDRRGDLLAVAGGRVALLAGSGSALVDVTESAGLAAIVDALDVRALDVDGDGLLDLVIEGSAGDRVLRQLSGGSYVELELGGAVAPSRTDPGLVSTAGPDDTPLPAPSEETPEGVPGRSIGGGARSVSGAAPGRSAGAEVLGRSETSGDPEGALGLAFCGPFLQDSSTGNCLQAFTVPTLGHLYPLSTHLNVNSAGRVGMGTTAPTHKLTIKGSSNDVLSLLGTGPVLSGARIDFGDPGGAYVREVADDQLEIGAGVSTNFAVGKVGFGQATPIWPFDMLKPQAVARFVSTTSTNGSVIELRNNVASPGFIGAINFVNSAGQFKGQIAYEGDDDLTLRVNGTQRARFAAGGNIELQGPLSMDLSGSSAVANLVNSSTVATTGAVFAQAKAPSGWALQAIASATTGTSYGVLGVTSSPSGFGVYSIGNFGGTGAKYFVQPHPTDASKEIRFVCLEGNESGTYFRGTARLVKGRAVIEVPEEFRLVTEREGLTVQITPVDGPAGFWVPDRDLDRIVVRGDADVAFDYVVNGVRRGFADHRAIQPNRSFVPTERGVSFGTQYPPALRRLLVANGTLNADFTPSEATAARLGWRLAERDEVPDLAAR